MLKNSDGGVSNLAKKLSKSTSYISKRIKLIELPKDVKELISISEVDATIGEELLSISNQHTQYKLARLIREKTPIL